ncbi:MAG: RDD family protein [Pseudomonadales bacterium]|jgi:uncharacterized RDD family membrane protein YckC|nr:RDD family protein [Pseudomonadales bacterium]
MDATPGPAREELVLTSVAGTEARLEIAGVGARSFAFIIDWHIRLLAAVVWFGGAGFLVGRYVGPGAIFEGSISWIAWLTFAPPAAIYFLYHPVIEALTGTTPGKRYAGVRIVTDQGLRPSLGAVLVRNLLRVVDSLPTLYVIGLSVAIVDGRARRLGDMAAGTLLVRVEERVDEVLDALGARGPNDLDPQLAELITDLLGRWKTLARDRRAELGRRVLARAGVESPPGDDEALRARLAALVGAPS